MLHVMCTACAYLVIWYGIGGVLRLAKIWYIGPPQRADSENIPHRVGFLFLTSYKLCNSHVPFRHHNKNIRAQKGRRLREESLA